MQPSCCGVDGAVTAARAAFPSWAPHPASDRAFVLQHIRDVVSDRAGPFADLIHRAGVSIVDRPSVARG